MLSDYTVQGSFPLPVNAVLLLYIKRHLDVGVLVTEAGHIGHLFLRQLQELVPFIILHLHHVKDALNFLQKKQTYVKERGRERERKREEGS